MADRQKTFLLKKESQSLSGKTLIELMKAVHAKGLPFRFRARGASMSPFVKDGDVITVAPVERTIRLGDIVTFVHPETGRPVVHRIIKRKGNFSIIRGDNAPVEDGLIPLQNILGTVTSVERQGKRVYLGLGIERHLIAFLSEKALLLHLVLIASPLRRLFRPFFKKMSL